MYSNDFVACVMVNGQALDEDRAGLVKVPWNSEYSIYLKNKNSVRASALVKVDGETVGDFEVPAYSHIEIKRPVSHDKAFKFVHVDSNEAKKEGKGRNDANGVIEVTWHLEKKEEVKYVPSVPSWKKKITDPVPYTPPWTPWPTPYYGDPGLSERPEVWCYSKESASFNGQTTYSSEQTRSLLPRNTRGSSGVSGQSVGLVQEPDPVGVTVDGDSTGQRFNTVYFDVEVRSTVMRLVLKGFEPVEDQTQKEIENLKKEIQRLEKKHKTKHKSQDWYFRDM